MPRTSVASMIRSAASRINSIGPVVVIMPGMESVMSPDWTSPKMSVTTV